jgi:hypothetical protein
MVCYFPNCTNEPPKTAGPVAEHQPPEAEVDTDYSAMFTQSTQTLREVEARVTRSIFEEGSATVS